MGNTRWTQRGGEVHVLRGWGGADQSKFDERMCISMGLIQDGDVGRLLQNPELMEEVAKGLLEAPETMDSLADDIADKLQDALEDDPDMRKRIVDAALNNTEFKRKIINKLVDEMS